MALIPARVRLVEFVIEEGKGAMGIIHEIDFGDGTFFEIYTPWSNGQIDTNASRFVKRTEEGNIQRLVPPEEKSVDKELRAIVRKFETTRQRVAMILHTHSL